MSIHALFDCALYFPPTLSTPSPTPGEGPGALTMRVRVEFAAKMIGKTASTATARWGSNEFGHKRAWERLCAADTTALLR